MSLNIVLDGGAVVAVVEPLQGFKVTFSASDITQRSTGRHANISIDQRSNSLNWGVINYERPSDRLTFSTHAHKMLPSEIADAGYTKEQLKADLDAFCKVLWTTYNGQFEAVWVEGDPDTTTEWYCPPLVMQEGSTILFGHRGGGKSWTALLAAICTQHGISNFWNPMETANALYINIERGPAGMRRRVARVNQAVGLSPRESLLMLNARGKNLNSIYEAARRSIEEHEVQVVFFDSISRAGAGNLNDNEPANAVMDMLSDLSPTWLAVGHMTESEGGKPKVFGSQMYENAVDVAIKLTGDQHPEELGVSLEITKGNDTPLGQLQYLRYEFNGTGLVGITNSSLSAFPDLDRREPNNREKIATYIDNSANGKATASEIAKALDINQGSVSKILQGNMFSGLPKDGSERPFTLAAREESE